MVISRRSFNKINNKFIHLYKKKIIKAESLEFILNFAM